MEKLIYEGQVFRLVVSVQLVGEGLGHNLLSMLAPANVNPREAAGGMMPPCGPAGCSSWSLAWAWPAPAVTHLGGVSQQMEDPSFFNSQFPKK